MNLALDAALVDDLVVVKSGSLQISWLLLCSEKFLGGAAYCGEGVAADCRLYLHTSIGGTTGAWNCCTGSWGRGGC